MAASIVTLLLEHSASPFLVRLIDIVVSASLVDVADVVVFEEEFEDFFYDDEAEDDFFVVVFDEFAVVVFEDEYDFAVVPDEEESEESSVASTVSPFSSISASPSALISSVCSSAEVSLSEACVIEVSLSLFADSTVLSVLQAVRAAVSIEKAVIKISTFLNFIGLLLYYVCRLTGNGSFLPIPLR